MHAPRGAVAIGYAQRVGGFLFSESPSGGRGAGAAEPPDIGTGAPTGDRGRLAPGDGRHRAERARRGKLGPGARALLHQR
jgi:hypothetical protein